MTKVNYQYDVQNNSLDVYVQFTHSNMSIVKKRFYQGLVYMYF